MRAGRVLRPRPAARATTHNRQLSTARRCVITYIQHGIAPSRVGLAATRPEPHAHPGRDTCHVSEISREARVTALEARMRCRALAGLSGAAAGDIRSRSSWDADESWRQLSICKLGKTECRWYIARHTMLQ